MTGASILFLMNRYLSPLEFIVILYGKQSNFLPASGYITDWTLTLVLTAFNSPDWTEES